MNSFVGGYSGSENQFGFNFESVSDYLDIEVVNGFQLKDIFPDSDILNLSSTSNTLVPVIHYTDLSKKFGKDSGEGNDLSDAVFKFINQTLMDDDSEDEDYTIQDSILHATEKSFYEILNKKDPSSPNQRLSYVESLMNVPLESQPCRRFDSGMEKTKMTLPGENDQTCDFDENGLMLITPVENENVLKVKGKLKNDGWGLPNSSSRGRRKSLQSNDSNLEEKGRSKKHLVGYAEESVLHEIIDKVLFYGLAAKGSNDAMTYPRRRVNRREAINMRNLLMKCMESIACNNHWSASELLMQIKRCSSPLGDGSQRLAHYFALSLEARLIGSKSPEFKSIAANMFDANVLKAYKLYFSTFPFTKTSHFFTNQAIMELMKTSTSLHIINFGIMYGLEWPSLIQHLSTRPRGPPKLRITGIDFPEANFRLAAMVKETECRLTSYCKRFNVPFEYNSIVQKWETVSIEDLRIDKDEVIVVHCLYQFMFLPDDTIMEHNPRDAVLNMIRRINPNIFIHGILNVNFNSPFFVSRFQEALFHFSAFFDMFEANVPRENKERMVFERDVLRNMFFNVLACEGSKRVARPETHKHWQARTVRAGFKQLPLNPQLIKEVRAKVKSCYHKDFFVDESGQWMVAGWKRRALVAFSYWKPA